jgi:hypothetical protein
VAGFAAPDLVKAPDLAAPFNQVPEENGERTLELAVELPDLLPSIDGKSEAVVSVRDADHLVRQLCLSNRISRFYYQDGATAYQAIVPRTSPWRGTATIKDDDGNESMAVEEQLCTVAAMRFQVKGDTGEHAFESAIKECISSFFACINLALQAIRECRLGTGPITRAIHWDAIPFVYVLLSGRLISRGARLVLSGGRIAAIPENLQGEQVTRFRAIVDRSIVLNDVDRMIGEARASWSDGDYEFAFLQAVIAAEIATKRAVTAECIRRGVSKGKVDDNRKDMTYSWALNIGLPLCFPSEDRPSPSLVGAMNAARSKRNDLMHEAIFDMKRQALDRLITDTRDYVNALMLAEKRSISRQAQRGANDNRPTSRKKKRPARRSGG